MPCGAEFSTFLLADRMTMEKWLPLGCDGSQMECPRTAELEQDLGKSSKEKSAPMLWITAVVSLTTGVLWSWRLGTSKTGERQTSIPSSNLGGASHRINPPKPVQTRKVPGSNPRHGEPDRSHHHVSTRMNPAQTVPQLLAKMLALRMLMR